MEMDFSVKVKDTVGHLSVAWCSEDFHLALDKSLQSSATLQLSKCSVDSNNVLEIDNLLEYGRAFELIDAGIVIFFFLDRSTFAHLVRGRRDLGSR